jgi:hypothetical protein
LLLTHLRITDILQCFWILQPPSLKGILMAKQTFKVGDKVVFKKKYQDPLHAAVYATFGGGPCRVLDVKAVPEDQTAMVGHHQFLVLERVDGTNQEISAAYFELDSST